jgi:histone deacetylase complex regulatory component SIN3
MRESRALFASHPALTETLNKFFDNGCGDDKVDTHTSFHQAHAMQYVVKVRNRFHDCPEVYG